MGRLSAADVASRLLLDYRVVQRMSGGIWRSEAYTSSADYERRRNQVTSENRATRGTRYRVTFLVPTLTSPGRWANQTEIGFDLGVADYPFQEPSTEILSPHVPYSPHFAPGRPVCPGEKWRDGGGTVLLGELLLHIARLLNWDESVRGGGYQGWNGAAIAYHRQQFGGRPLNPALCYPVLPVDLVHGLDAGRSETASFMLSATPARPSPDGLFTAGRRRG